MSNPNHLNIALHNEDTSKYLYADNDKRFNDWVVTTAFYSAMHFLYHKLLPYSYGSPAIQLNTFDQLYHTFRRNNANYTENQHEFTKRWVRQQTNPVVSAYYQSLFDQCHNARYQGYITDNRDAKNRLKQLDEIKKYCTV